MVRWGIILLAYFWLTQATAVAAEPMQSVKSTGYTQLTLRISNKNLVQVGLKQTTMDKDYPYEADLLWGFFTDTSSNYLLTSISIQDDGQSIEVPLSAYADLANVRFASIVPLPHGFCLNIYGGDTGTAYTAKLTFGSGVTLSRTIYDNEFPDQVNEKTSYSFISPDSPN
jgi:hypothetical protein